MSYISDLHNKYVNNKKINFYEYGSRSSPHCYLMSFRAGSAEVTLAIDFEGVPQSCPCVRVISPVFQFDGMYPVRPSGLVVVNGVTPLTWNQGDVVKLLYEALCLDVPPFYNTQSYPPTSIVNTDKLMLYTRIGSQFDLTEASISVDHNLKGNEASVACDEEYVVLVSSLGLKTVCNVVGDSKEHGHVKVSENVLCNLLGDTNVEYGPMFLGAATELRLRCLDGTPPSLDTTASLSEYEVVSSGDVIKLDGHEFVVECALPRDMVKLSSSEFEDERVNIVYV